jgi:lipid-A-disaccharide synthase-like uncharacterized protein
VKKEPILLMVLLFGLGAWLVTAPRAKGGLPDTRPGAIVEDLRVGPARGAVEILREADGGETFRLLLRDGTASAVLDEADFDALFGAETRELILRHAGNPVFRVLNITRWSSAIWIAVGFAGQIAFFGRMAIQWAASERERRSVVPELFWWLSLGGGVLLFTYFVWRRDIIGVMGQSTGVVIYGRNLRLINKTRNAA